MRNRILALTAAFALAVATAPTFAATKGGSATAQQQTQANSQSSNVDTNCAKILANPESYGSADVERCRAL